MFSFFWCLAFLLQFNLVFMSVCDQPTCHECITDPNICAWCAMVNLTETVRCKPAKSLPEDWCPPKFIKNPISEKAITGDENFSSYEKGNVIQIKPQMYNMKLRPGDSLDFNFSYLASEDYPVDLYFLMDASLTMSTIKSKTIQQSQNIYEVLRNKTQNVFLGLGTFVDKNVPPFTNRINSTLAYSFNHQLDLMGNYAEFNKKLISTRFGENRDLQESGLDALAQVMACKSVGWRNDSTKIIVFLTDGSYHVAGDGKAAGIFEPYDGECYLKDNVYTRETLMDYPSLGMINKLAMDKNMIIIFLVHKSVKYAYDPLEHAIRGSKCETFSDTMESDKLVTIIKNIYEGITNNIVLQVDQKSSQNFQLEFNPDCTMPNIESCKIKSGQKQDFHGTITLTKYSGVENSKIYIKIEGMSDKLTLNVDVINKCDCDDDVVFNSPDCHNETLQCGQCICSDKRYGNKCACEKNEKNQFNDNSTCIALPTSDTCSGHGECICGACVCNPGYTGRFCECYNAACKGCTGPEHGTCDCGTCKCINKYRGEFCECHDHFCIPPKDIESKDICNNRGKCQCKTCKCDDRLKWDKRSEDDFCKLTLLPEIHNMQCEALEPCVLCELDTTKCGHSDDCKNGTQIELVQILSEDLLENPDWSKCEGLSVDVGCKTRFIYHFDDIFHFIKIIVQKEKECAQDYWVIGGVFLLMLILIGVGTLIGWKVITYKRDMREFNEFVKQNEQDISELHDSTVNPLYSGPTVLFKNPGFRKRSFR